MQDRWDKNFDSDYFVKNDAEIYSKPFNISKVTDKVVVLNLDNNSFTFFDQEELIEESYLLQTKRTQTLEILKALGNFSFLNFDLVLSEQQGKSQSSLQVDLLLHKTFEIVKELRLNQKEMAQLGIDARSAFIQFALA